MTDPSHVLDILCQYTNVKYIVNVKLCNQCPKALVSAIKCSTQCIQLRQISNRTFVIQQGQNA